jgi:hypothetical protein
MNEKRRRVFLQAIDPDHGCPVLEVAFFVDDPDELAAVIGLGEFSQFGLSADYPIDRAQLTEICHRFRVAFDSGDCEIVLSGRMALRHVPYLVHTNYELPMLLEGTKPFARMGEEYPPFEHQDEDRFDRYVAGGMLHKEIVIEPFTRPMRGPFGQSYDGIRHVYYTRIGEEWRIPAWKLVMAASKKSGWNEHYERLEGMLLGYTEWQMDWWISHTFKK